MLALVVIASLSFAAANISNKNDIIDEGAENTEPAKNFEFSIFTSAVCENKTEIVNCRDEVFVNCDGEISKLGDAAECNGLKFDVPKATGFAVFNKDWQDPRN